MNPLVELARKAVEEWVRSGQRIKVPEDIQGEFLEPAAAFVCLKKHGVLRGCIGTTSPRQPSVAAEVIDNAVSACCKDPRFPAVEPEELDSIEYTVDVLSPSEAVTGLDELDPAGYGVIVTKGSCRGLLLPDLEGVDTVEKQLAIARRKAGIDPGETDVEIRRFTVKRYK